MRFRLLVALALVLVIGVLVTKYLGSIAGPEPWDRPEIARVQGGTGFFVDSNTLITAAHLCPPCSEGSAPGSETCPIWVQLYTTLGDRDSLEVVDAECVKECNYDARTGLNDVMKCSIASTGLSSPKAVSKCDSRPTRGTTVTGVGFGCVDTSPGHAVKKVHYAKLNVLADPQDSRIYLVGATPSSMACSGDSGGPILKGAWNGADAPGCYFGVVSCGFGSGVSCGPGTTMANRHPYP